eukprot:CAMPEP_0198309664 /NCGR_PEP_ID=MMETSP1450-20131203/1971_1 /TAXON_ID=753684 ORGANISM="Madagascaria erythrocladiodes, Strain CCMP3234" /NCGR_SAMPLE_ID=MMETSP1450 /ASSEMBLY_ACC=CAM_ASM_001115 /LENGTH=364 /DNA_ID=CAMNT_0044012431 /DNA_START=20 /DNA_END=1114 /DNA_ORIENTATION=+
MKAAFASGPLLPMRKGAPARTTVLRCSASHSVPRRDVLRTGLTTAAAAAAVAATGTPPESALAHPLPSTTRAPVHELIFDTRVGSFLPAHADRLLAARQGALASRVVAVGEIHTHPVHHRLQLDVVRALHNLTEKENAANPDRRPRHLVVGLEHFYRQHQVYLDGFVWGDISLDRLVQLTNWDSTFGYDIALWEPILNYARDQRIRLVGLNVPRELMSLVSQQGLANLPPSLRAMLPEVDLSNARHYSRFRESLAEAHGDLSEDSIARYYECFALWDEFMAASASQHLSKYPETRMVVLAGAAHIEDKTGIPDRITRRTGLKTFTILPQSVGWTPENLPNIEEPTRNRNVADWVWFTQLESELA